MIMIQTNRIGESIRTRGDAPNLFSLQINYPDGKKLSASVTVGKLSRRTAISEVAAIMMICNPTPKRSSLGGGSAMNFRCAIANGRQIDYGH